MGSEAQRAVLCCSQIPDFDGYTVNTQECLVFGRHILKNLMAVGYCVDILALNMETGAFFYHFIVALVDRLSFSLAGSEPTMYQQ